MDRDVPPLSTDLIETLEEIGRLRGGLAGWASSSELKAHVLAMLRKHQFFSCYMTKGGNFWRGRVVDGNRFTNADELGAPSPAKTKHAGRCHTHGKPVFYASSEIGTVLAELAPAPGQVICLSRWTVTSDVPISLVAIGELDHFRRTGRTSVGESAGPQIEEMRRIAKDLTNSRSLGLMMRDGFFAEEFRRPAPRQLDYRLTSAIAELMLEKEYIPDGDRTKSTRHDGLLYSSVASMGAANVALRPSSAADKLAMTRCMEVVSTGHLGAGIFNYTALANAHGIDRATGWIVWDEVPVELQVSVSAQS